MVPGFINTYLLLVVRICGRSTKRKLRAAVLSARVCVPISARTRSQPRYELGTRTSCTPTTAVYIHICILMHLVNLKKKQNR